MMTNLKKVASIIVFALLLTLGATLYFWFSEWRPTNNVPDLEDFTTLAIFLYSLYGVYFFIIKNETDETRVKSVFKSIKSLLLAILLAVTWGYFASLNFFSTCEGEGCWGGIILPIMPIIFFFILFIFQAVTIFLLRKNKYTVYLFLGLALISALFFSQKIDKSTKFKMERAVTEQEAAFCGSTNDNWIQRRCLYQLMSTNHVQLIDSIDVLGGGCKYFYQPDRPIPIYLDYCFADEIRFTHDKSICKDIQNNRVKQSVCGM